MELNAQQKQFDLIIKQNSTLLVAMAKGYSGGNGVSGGGSSGRAGGGRRGKGGGGNKPRDQATKAVCLNCNKFGVHAGADCFTLPAN
jgi:hypothetical protein